MSGAAFTGAITARQGRFEIAQGGTLFLDEIGEMSSHMQVKLLRVLQQKTFERVGSSHSCEADVRIIAATNRDLEAEVRAGRFREDLFFRLNVFPIQMPALRQRPQDLPALIHLFHTQLELRGHRPVRFAPETLAALKRHPWLGNVRELENLLERLSVMQPGAWLEVEGLPERYRAGAEPPVAAASIMQPAAMQGDDDLRNAMAASGPAWLQLPAEGVCLRSVLADIERDLVQQALARSDGVVSHAARLLKLGRTTLLEKIRKLHPPKPDTPRPS